MAAFVPTKLNQAAMDKLKQSFQGVTLSNVTPAPVAANQTVQAQGVAPKTNSVPAPQAAPFKPTVLNQAAQDALKQNLQGVTLSNVNPVAANTAVTPQPSQKPLIGPILTPTRPMVDVPAPVSAPTVAVTNKPPASFTGTLPGPYPSYDANGKISSIQAGMKVVNGVPQPNGAPVAASNTVPAPASQGSSFPGQLTSAQIQAEAQARIDKQRAAITEATNAANAARKNVFDYTNQITGDNRTLENGAFNETHDPFTGQTGYAQAQLQRNRSIQDTANNNNYQADITANNQKVTDFETLAPEQQQAILDQLTKQERDYGLQVGALTGQFNGQNTMQQNQNNFSNGISQGNLTGNYTGPVGGQGQGMMFAQGAPTGQNNQASDMAQFNANQKAWATANPQQQQALHQQNTDIASRYGGQYNSQTGQWNFPQNGNTGIGGGLNQSQGVPTLAAKAQDFNQMANNRDFAYQQSRDLIKDKQYQQTFDQNNKQFGLDYAIKQATLANQITNDQAQRAIGYMNAQTSQQNANTSSANSINSQNNIVSDNARADAATASKAYQDTFGNLKDLYTAKDPDTGSLKVTNPSALRSAIIAKNMTDAQTIQMLTDFGLPIHP